MRWLANKFSNSGKHAAEVADLEGQLASLRQMNEDLGDRVSILQGTNDQQQATISEQSRQHRELVTNNEQSLLDKTNKYDQVVSLLHRETSDRYQQQRETLLAEERAVQAERALALSRGTDMTSFTLERNLDLRTAKLRQPFVLVLIDGDAYSFQDLYVSAGKKGGANLAQDIRNEIVKLAETRAEISTDTTVVVRMFMNKVNACSVTTERLGEQLMRPFDACLTNASQTLCLFDIIDCGTGKERVDSKIHANFHLYVKNSDCQAILLGACSDNGFVRLLEPYIGNPLLERKILLLTLGSTAAEFHDLIQPKGPFLTLRWPSIFREQLSPSQRRDQPRRRTVATLPSIPDARRRYSHRAGSRESVKSLGTHTETLSNTSLNSAEPSTSNAPDGLPNLAVSSERNAYLTPPQSPVANPKSNSGPQGTNPLSGNLKSQGHFPTPKIANLQVHRPTKKTHPTIARWQPLYMLRKARIDHPWKQSSLPGDKLMSYADGNSCYEHVHFGHCSKGVKCACRHEDIDDDKREGIRWHLQRIPCPKGAKCRKYNCVRGHPALTQG
ncbi:MAG: hypothetical protein Q9160_004322 [Pyrenula sp. 1 TL-2023]